MPLDTSIGRMPPPLVALTQLEDVIDLYSRVRIGTPVNVQ